jgi:hypothetical protein
MKEKLHFKEKLYSKEKLSLYDPFPDFKGSTETKLKMIEEDIITLIRLGVISVDEDVVRWVYPMPLYGYREFYNLVYFGKLVWKNKRLFVRE